MPYIYINISGFGMKQTSKCFGCISLMDVMKLARTADIDGDLDHCLDLSETYLYIQCLDLIETYLYIQCLDLIEAYLYIQCLYLIGSYFYIQCWICFPANFLIL